jgi:glutaminase
MNDSQQYVHPLAAYLSEVHARHVGEREGNVADYIPELSKADPNAFGIAVATVDGQIYEMGDTAAPFTIQSISKPFVYAMALADRGRDAVLSKIGVEPSGDAFNSISLYGDTGRPFNPMINAGAIASTGILRVDDESQRFERILHWFSECAGRDLEVDETVYRSERDTGFRNFAIGYMLRNFGILESDPEPILDAYFKQCSILVTARDLATMAATLANGGVCPTTERRVVDAVHVPQVLSVMATCGMYDYAGERVYRIGMPSKSGAGGGIIGVLPGQMAVAVYSPPLDERGNSVRGIRVFEDLSNDFGLHIFQSSHAAQHVIRRHYEVSSVSSKRMRTPTEQSVLAQHGRSVAVYELQGDLTIFSAERVVREILELDESASRLVIDFKRVSSVEAPASKLLHDFLGTCESRFENVFLTEFKHMQILAATFRSSCNGTRKTAFEMRDETDAALEACEERLLCEIKSERMTPSEASLERFEVCTGLDSSQVSELRGVLVMRTYGPGDLIVRSGEAATALYFLTKGRVSVVAELPNGDSRRLTTCSPGMMFGDMAIVERRPRSATVRADEAVECYSLSLERFDRLGETNPDLKVALLENFARSLSRRVRRLTNEVRTLAS